MLLKEDDMLLKDHGTRLELLGASAAVEPAAAAASASVSSGASSFEHIKNPSLMRQLSAGQQPDEEF